MLTLVDKRKPSRVTLSETADLSASGALPELSFRYSEHYPYLVFVGSYYAIYEDQWHHHTTLKSALRTF